MAHKEFTKITTEVDEESKMSCGFCAYLGKNTFDLSVHIASHMAEKRYKCAYCDYTQFQIGKVSKHLKTIHPERSEMVIDRELKKASNSMIRLVNLNPEVKIDAMNSGVKKRKYKRIMVETDESSNNSYSFSTDNDKASSGSKTNKLEELEKMSKAHGNNSNFKESRDSENKNEELVSDSKNPSNKTDNTKVQPLQLSDIQNTSQEECSSEDDDVTKTPFTNMDVQSSSQGFNFSDCDKLNKSKSSDVGERNGGENETGFLITKSGENTKEKSETNAGNEHNQITVENVNSDASVQNNTKLGNSAHESMREQEDGETSLQECESTDLGSKSCIDKSVDELIGDENKGDDPTSNENVTKGKSSKDLNKDIEPENTCDPSDDKDKEQANNIRYDVGQEHLITDCNHGIDQRDVKDDINCDDKIVDIDKDSGFTEQKIVNIESKGNVTDEILKDGTSESGNDGVGHMGNVSQSVNENSKEGDKLDLQNEEDHVFPSSNSMETPKDDGETENEQIKSPRNVFKSMLEVQKLNCEQTNKNDGVTSELNTANFEMKDNVDKVEKVGNENVFEKFSSKLDYINSPDDMDINEGAEKSPKELSDNIFEKFSNDRVTGDEDSESKIISCKSNESTLENIEKDGESKSDEDNQLLDNDKNLFEKFSKESLTVQLPTGVNTFAESTSKDNIEEENQSLKNEDNKSISEDEKRVEDMEIDELINSIEETVNEGKVKHLAEKGNLELENSDMEVD